MVSLRRIMLVVCLLAAALPIGAKEFKPQPYSTRVWVSVTADEKIKSSVESYITRELRSLGDVTPITDVSTAKWQIKLQVMKVSTESNRDVGYAIATTFLEVFDSQLILNFLTTTQMSDVDIKMVRWLLDRNLVIDRQGLLSICPLDKLQSSCEGIVTAFDTGLIAPERKSWQEMNDLIKKAQESKEKQQTTEPAPKN